MKKLYIMSKYRRIDDSKFSKYLTDLTNVAMLSQLFSESDTPYLSSRTCERVFCHVFDASDISRDDSAIDAKFMDVGIGIKTFIHNNGRTFQKIAEFNADRPKYIDLTAQEKIKLIAKLRNERMRLAMRTYGVTELQYHCITREAEEIHIFEEEMQFIDIDRIQSIVCSPASITFSDGRNEYLFSLSKSTLFKKFVLNEPIISFKVEIIKDIFAELPKLTKHAKLSLGITPVSEKTNDLGYDLVLDEEETLEFIVLPLYSVVGSIKKVMPKSGLNQWNAAGRPRDFDEVYIPISRKIHSNFPNFFPDRDHSFDLELPDGRTMNAKVCQDNSKALMSNPNKDLGKWILRDILALPQGEVLTYERLQELGIDSVKITKIDSDHFKIDFCGLETFDDFSSNFIL